MISPVHPALIFILGALILPLVPGRRTKQALLLFVPLAALAALLVMPYGTYWTYKFLSYRLVFARVDKLSLCFGYAFVIMAFLSAVYALHIRQSGQHSATFLSVGSTLGVVFAGDVLTLFAFWELLAVSSVFVIWYGRSKQAYQAGFRYLMVHLFGGTLLLAGMAMSVLESGSTEFTRIAYGSLSSMLILVSFLINAAVPPMHAWLSDAYPEASPTGSVFLTAFTTKSAVYVLLRAYPGLDLLVWLGTIMALYGIVYAVLENDIRRLLAYHIISQVGYMVCGVGLGSEMALNGSIAHAFSHILYKALLFMGVGAVIEMTGRSKMTELQGRNLYRRMPLCLTLYMIGGFSISSVPLFNGFISKNMVVAAASELHRPAVHLLLHLASVGTFLHTGLKLPYGTWFGQAGPGEQADRIEAKEPPLNMLLAMGLAAFLCTLFGVYPKLLYDLLPYPVTYTPYTAYGVVGALQLLAFTAAAFYLFRAKLGGEPTISVDTDWFYRKGGTLFFRFCDTCSDIRSSLQDSTARFVERITCLSANPGLSLKAVLSGQQVNPAPYDADTYRRAVGAGVMLALVLFSFLCLVFLLS
ncbi:MAG: Na(+)/H(+) antiporter subunit D [Thermodesulfobacteriota bacterium]